jgi:hypothetical protein
MVVSWKIRFGNNDMNQPTVGLQLPADDTDHTHKARWGATATSFKKAFKNIGLLLAGVSLLFIGPHDSWASSDDPRQHGTIASESQTKPWYQKIEWELSGHLKAWGGISWADEESFFQPVGTGPYYDGYAEARLKGKLYFGKWGYFEAHHETILSGGDTWRKLKELQRLYPYLFTKGVIIAGPLDDNRRLMDLTWTIHEDEHYILYNRFDRLSLTLLPKWGAVTIGRQAVTWGNGLLFNPMDLFNPFAPTDIERDYKIGDDMVSSQFSLGKIGNVHFLYVPRRDPVRKDVQWNHSSLAGKFHFAWDTAEFDIMAAKHYEDAVFGIGSTGYLGSAAWRVDGIWTLLNNTEGKGYYFSLVANMDYSWVWWGKNFYGFVEFFYSGIGEDNYTEALLDQDIIERLDRGELFTLGRTYLSGHIRMELHPLLNVYLTVINNLVDPSGVIQPRVVWDVLQDLQVTFGGNVYYGQRGTEYGGFRIPGTPLLAKGRNSVFLWVTYYF